MSCDKDLYRFLNITRGTCLADSVTIASTFLARMKGLLGTNDLARGGGLFITPCNSIHMIGMRYPIDAVFVDCQLKVVAVVDSIKPGQLSGLYPKAHSCLEIAAGKVNSSFTEAGDQLALEKLN